jgi:arylsulfatase A-like enzyme
MAWTAHYQYETDWFVARTMLKACEWLEENAERDSFFLWVDTFEPHEVWNAPIYYTEMYSPDYKGIDYSYPNYGYTDIYQPHEIQRLRVRYGGEVTLTDRWVGHLLRQIEYMGLFEDTTVILTSDHGMYLGEHNRMGKHTVDYTDPWPLLDEVARVPLLVWSPLAEAPNITDVLVQPADLMPTVLEICDIPSKAPYGRSWLPILRGEAEDHWDHIFSSYFSWEGEGKIGYLRSQITVTTRDWSLVVGPPPYEAQLFDRRIDHNQEHDRAGEYPEVVDQLCSILADFMAEQGAKPEYISAFTGDRAI